MKNTRVILLSLILFISIIIVSSFQTHATNNKQFKVNNTSNVSNIDVQLNITNVDLINTTYNDMLLNVSFEVINLLNRDINITTSADCQPFLVSIYAFPESGQPFRDYQQNPSFCGQTVTTWIYTPGINNRHTYYSFKTQNPVPNGKYYLQVEVTQPFSFGEKATSNAKVVQVQNNAITQINDYYPINHSYNQTITSFTNVSFLGTLSYASGIGLKFNSSFTVYTSNGEFFFPRSTAEDLFFDVSLNNTDVHNFQPVYGYFSYVYNEGYGIPSMSNEEVSFYINSSSIPNGNYSMHLESFESTNFVINYVDTTWNYVTFEYNNGTVSNIQYSNPLLPPSLINMTTTSSTSTSISSQTNPSTTTSTNTTTTFLPPEPSKSLGNASDSVIVLLAVFSIVYFRRKKNYNENDLF